MKRKKSPLDELILYTDDVEYFCRFFGHLLFLGVIEKDYQWALNTVVLMIAERKGFI